MDETVGFEWDPFKAEANHAKHGIAFRQAAKAMLGLALTRLAQDGVEKRFASIGISGERLIVIIWTPRQDALRIISARRARRHERKTYREVLGQADRIAGAD